MASSCSALSLFLLLVLELWSITSQPPLEGGIGFELPCGEDNLSCPHTGNVSVQCYTREELCDGVEFCGAVSDEGKNTSLECNLGSPVEAEFVCQPDGMKVPAEVLCDGINNCNNGVDETTPLCENKCRLPYYGGCPYTRECITSEFGVSCGDCAVGYAVDPDNPTADCIDINECVNETIICPDGARCNNTEGSFFCECKDGFTEVEQLCLRDKEEEEEGEEECPEESSNSSSQSSRSSKKRRRSGSFRRARSSRRSPHSRCGGSKKTSSSHSSSQGSTPGRLVQGSKCHNYYWGRLLRPLLLSGYF